MVELKYPPPKEFLEPETRDGYFISKEMKEVWAVELDLLQELLRVCQKYNLKIFADAGTLLGAIRHKGYIPWDDDIDMAMFSSDYKKLCDVAPQEFKHPYFLQVSDSGKELLYGHAKLRNTETTAILKCEENRTLTYNQGIFLDVFPLNNLPDKDLSLKVQLKKWRTYRFLSWGFAFLSTRYFESKNKFFRPFKKIFHIMFNDMFADLQSFFYRRMLAVSRQYNSINTKRIFISYTKCPRNIFFREDYSETLATPFEFLKIPTMKGYDRILTTVFKDWRTPCKAPTAHGMVFFDTNKSYKEYLTKVH